MTVDGSLKKKTVIHASPKRRDDNVPMALVIPNGVNDGRQVPTEEDRLHESPKRRDKPVSIALMITSGVDDG